MKIAIKWDETKLTLRFPTALVLNRLTAGIVRKSLKKQGVRLTRKQTVLFIKELKKYKKTHRDWNLVEVEEDGKNSVIIKI
jgi:replication-associated recombination protein RarA